MKIAVLIPCMNEEKTIARVVEEFREQLPEASIYVYDNNSNDKTIEEANKTGAFVSKEVRQGKGNVIRSMFNNIDAEIYVLVDGDGTYPADKVHKLIAPIIDQEADMVNGSRLHDKSVSCFRRLNFYGNKMFLMIIDLMFNVRITDLLSGYRAFNRKIVKNLPLFGEGFEIETEITLKAHLNGFRILEIPVNLSKRHVGSSSKINVLRDGLRIIGTLLSIYKNYKPRMFQSIWGGLIILISSISGFVVLSLFRKGSSTPNPIAFLAVGLALIGVIAMVCVYLRRKAIGKS